MSATELGSMPDGATPDAATLAEPVVLLIDDNDGARYAARRTLEQAGFAVVEAATGQAAMASRGARSGHLARARRGAAARSSAA